LVGVWSVVSPLSPSEPLLVDVEGARLLLALFFLAGACRLVLVPAAKQTESEKALYNYHLLFWCYCPAVFVPYHLFLVTLSAASVPLCALQFVILTVGGWLQGLPLPWLSSVLLPGFFLAPAELVWEVAAFLLLCCCWLLFDLLSSGGGVPPLGRPPRPPPLA